MAKNKALLVVSFGTSYQETREKTIVAIERDLKAVFPERTFYRAWTSGFIRKKLLERDGKKILSPQEALETMAADGVSDILIQPTHLLAGAEFGKITDSLKPQLKNFEKVSVGGPLLEKPEDVAGFVRIIAGLFAGMKETELAVFMGHGSDRTAFPVYELINEAFNRQGYNNLCVGTVDFEPGIEPVLAKVREKNPEKVFLSPLLVVAGDHAIHDMAGDEEDSWKTLIAKEGTEVECIMKGLGEYAEIRSLYVQRAKNATAERGSSPQA